MYSDNHTRNKPGITQNYGASLDASYDITLFDILTFWANIRPPVNNHPDIRSLTVYSDAAGSITRELESKSRGTGNNSQYTAGLNYQHSFKNKPGQLLTFTYGYNNNANMQIYEQENLLDGSIDKHYTSQSTTGSAEHTAGIDFYNPVSTKQSYFFTGKYVHRSYGSDAWERNNLSAIETLLDAMDYTQQVGTVRANYTQKWTTWMVSAQAEVEYQYNNAIFRPNNTAFAKGDYTWAANLRFTYRPTATTNFMLILGKNTSRPDIRQLNPYEDCSVPGQISKGNPALDNINSYGANLSFSFFLNKTLTVRCMIGSGYWDNNTQPYTYVDNNGLFVTTYVNTGNYLRAHSSLSASYNPFSWLQLEVSGSANYNKIKYFDNRNTYWGRMYDFITTSELWKGGHFSIDLRYAEPNLFTVPYSTQSQKQHLLLTGWFTLSQSFGNGWSCRVTISNPWEAYTIKKTEDAAADFYSYREAKELGRVISLSLGYTFGRFKESVKISGRKVTNTDGIK
jgi:hypothetical protein